MMSGGGGASRPEISPGATIEQRLAHDLGMDTPGGIDLFRQRVVEEPDL